MKTKIHYWFKNYFEITAFSVGLILLAFMNPHAANGPDLCLFRQVGLPFCPGDGLGHSIAYTFHGEFINAMKANMLGPFSILILSGRIIQLLYKKHYYNLN
ncbi:MAG TPA: DUF2752 domain-containing protein [Balneolaceae bacterium]|nr:DUF2752 domain-containing protein [Balneolaceae bacterium]